MDTMIKNGNFSPNSNEKCVICGCSTGYKFNTPIEQRQFFVEGAGQLCRNCFAEVYSDANNLISSSVEDRSLRFEKAQQGEEPFDYKIQYSDEYYNLFIQKFVPNTKKRMLFRFVKRTFDIVSSFFGLLVLSPVMLIIAIAIKCDSKGPVIFKQQRVGRGGKPFNCYKFRSMKTTAPKNCATSVLGDPTQYLTRVGRILRKLSLDELPQLFCCLIGTMSVIGYRPLILKEENCNRMREQLGVFAMRPGISGYAQVLGRDDVYYKNKAILDAEYVKNASLWFDIKLIIKTALVVVRRDGNDTGSDEKR